MGEPIASFAGKVQQVSGPGPNGITLLGTIIDSNVETARRVAQLSLVGIGHIELPSSMDDLMVTSLSSSELMLRSGTREWRIACRTWQLHLDVGSTFYAAVPPRATPWMRRATWRILLGLAATSPGRWLLSRSRRAA